MRVSKVYKLVTIGMLSSIAYLLMLLNFPLPGFPPFLQIDFSDIPALLAAILMGPVAGITVEFIKCTIDYFSTGSTTGVPVGQISNFMAGVLLILPTYWIFQKFNSKRGLSLGLAAGTVTMTVFMGILNYYIFLPAYSFFLDQPVMSGEEMRMFVTVSILPFNLVKGIIVTVIFLMIYRSMSKWIQNQKQTVFRT